VDQPGGVRRVEAAAGRDERRDDIVSAARLGQPAPQGHALDVLHRDEQVVLGEPDVVDRDHVGMGEPRHRLGLAEQPRAPLPVAAHPAQPLDRDRAAEVRIARAVHHAHAAGADQLLDHVAPELRAARQPRRLDDRRRARRLADRARHGGRRARLHRDVDGVEPLARDAALGAALAHGDGLRLRGRGSS
jgi:hypothetical protein